MACFPAHIGPQCTASVLQPLANLDVLCLSFPSFLVTGRLNKLVMVLEEGHDVTGRNRLWEGAWGCIMTRAQPALPRCAM